MTLTARILNPLAPKVLRFPMINLLGLGEIQYLLQVHHFEKSTAVKALLNFNRLKYTFPSNNYKVLVSHIVTADALGADHILQYVGEKLFASGEV